MSDAGSVGVEPISVLMDLEHKKEKSIKRIAEKGENRKLEQFLERDRTSSFNM